MKLIHGRKTKRCVLSLVGVFLALFLLRPDCLPSIQISWSQSESDDGLVEPGWEDLRIFCLVLTQPKRKMSHAIPIKKTWGRKCNQLLFVSTKEDEELPSIGVTAKGESREILWQKSREAWQYIHDHHRDGFDWYIRTDDDAYVVMENLRYFLASKKKEDLIAYGYKFKRKGSGAYFSGGPGYVMTRPAMIQMVTQALPMKNNSCLPSGGQFEDWKMGQCLENVGVTLGDDRDVEGRSRFFPLNVGGHIMFGANPPIGPWSNLTWFEKITFYPPRLGFQCCSPSGISTHYANGYQMYLLEYAIYHLRIYRMD
ncbi:unnamed protein product [Darwinula stevensoni]|uniref:N-acetylgalactosaminide beta-1,3-galactosyltransferase n=1 Tax=Darwinula stevensoni TaxID=69355 RepID=A0A7R9AD26_9CRUS|nr:unnamed protein product [Darwinula stevensoni]CAG0900905.1 unnamed protein product [Darwinula stevensoni]